MLTYKAYYRLNNVFLNGSVSRKTKVKVYKTAIQPQITHIANIIPQTREVSK